MKGWLYLAVMIDLFHGESWAGQHRTRSTRCSPFPPSTAGYWAVEVGDEVIDRSKIVATFSADALGPLALRHLGAISGIRRLLHRTIVTA